MPFKNKTNNFLIISVCNKHSEIGKVTFSNVALLIIFLRKQLKGNKHEKKNWIYALIVTLIIIIAIVSMIFFVQTKYGDQSEKGSQSVSNKNNKIHIAIVNEDQPTTYNGKKVELGQAFIKRLANEKNYKFETVTRNVAESGLKNGGYQVMIVIPENFSKLAMQLDAKTPSKISLQYKTAVGQKEEVAKNTEKVVSNVLNDFNKNLVEIYLTSIIDNLHNAQKNVGAIMTREHGVNSKFSNYLLNPINDFPELFTDTLVNSISANKDITKWFQTYNKSLLSANSDTFRVNTDYNVSTLIENKIHYLTSTIQRWIKCYKIINRKKIAWNLITISMH